MSAERFSLDADILFYAMDVDAGPRHRLAAAVVDRSIDADCRLTVQALSEFFVAVSRKRVVPPDVAAAQVEAWLTLFPIIAPTSRCVRGALAHASAGRASYWDALILETAAESGCVCMISEDMADGAVFGAITVRHPFDGERLSPIMESLLAN